MNRMKDSEMYRDRDENQSMCLAMQWFSWPRLLRRWITASSLHFPATYTYDECSYSCSESCTHIACESSVHNLQAQPQIDDLQRRKNYTDSLGMLTAIFNNGWHSGDKGRVSCDQNVVVSILGQALLPCRPLAVIYTYEPPSQKSKILY